ncbi:sensor domain-containing protein [Solimonas marina]|uniref:Sensor domain-containing protein n=1 Tax=Solimonas marina TaxID=2714601 RepID=A0A970B8M5_9GAMM|nr:sensor domain-containing protein [Solimonas marina]NKF22434.1 sensor domain-containing protein [Solimonas marina]
MRVLFPYLAQIHQIPHSLPVAVQLALRHPQIEVHVAGVSPRHLETVRQMLGRHAPQARIALKRLDIGWEDRGLMALGRSIAGKRRTMRLNRDYFAGFDAIVTPESTSLYLRKLGIGATMIRTGHGAGDRAIAVSERVGEFDLVLIGGDKMERRMLDVGIIRRGAYVKGVYAKFDWMLPSAAGRAPLFDNGRPTVLYNPHFRPQLSSWPKWGRAVLEHFAADTRYNLIFAPHIRLFDSPMRKLHEHQLRRYAALPNIHVDLGSERSIDMSYTGAADLYLGDVSSQVTEFLYHTRPCAFLNAHGVQWTDDPNYRFWHMGPVVEACDELGATVDRAFATHADYVDRQRHYFTSSFGLTPGQTSSPHAADGIAQFLDGQAIVV